MATVTPQKRGSVGSPRARASVGAVTPMRECDAPIQVLGRGTGGIDELGLCLKPVQKVAWGVLRFSFGTGAFARDKRIFVHFNFEKSTVARGRQNAFTDAVRKAMPSIHASLTFTEHDEVTLDNIVEKIQGAFVNDDIASSGSNAKSLKAQLEESMAASKRKAEEARKQGFKREPTQRKSTRKKTAPRVPKSAIEGMTLENALRAVTMENGPLNWIWLSGVTASHALFGAGNQSIKEMQELADDKEVLHGLLRVSFGQGKMRRSKWAFVLWIGQGIGAVKRGKLIADHSNMLKFFRDQAVICTTFEITDRADFGEEQIIERFRKVALTDGGADGDDGAFSFEAYLEALKEEEERLARLAARGELGLGDDEESESESDSDDAEETPAYDRDETIALLSVEAGEYNWALFALEQAALARGSVVGGVPAPPRHSVGSSGAPTPSKTPPRGSVPSVPRTGYAGTPG